MIRSAIYFLATALVCTLILELYIRGAEISGVSETAYNHQIGRIIRPNAKVVHYNENFTYSQINEYGYLGPSYTPRKAPGTFRVALLGDSYVEGFQVLERHHFRTILEEKLRSELIYDSVEILNFGRSGFGLEDAYAYDINFVSDFNPDLKIYLLSAYDFYQNSGDRLLPKWKLEGDALVQDRSYRESKELKVYNSIKLGLQHSTILQMMRNGVNIIKEGKSVEVLLGKLSPYFIEEEVAPYEKELQRKRLVISELPEIPKAILAKLSDEGNIMIANRDSIAFPEHLRKEISYDGIHLIDLSDTLAPLMKNHELNPKYWPVTHRQGHWNYRGHRAVGEYLSRVLVEEVGPQNTKLGYKE